MGKEEVVEAQEGGKGGDGQQDGIRERIWWLLGLREGKGRDELGFEGRRWAG